MPIGINGESLGNKVDDQLKLFNKLQKDGNNKINLMSSLSFFVSVNDKIEKIGTDEYMIDILYELTKSVIIYNKIKQVNWDFITIVNHMLDRYIANYDTIFVGQEINIINNIIKFKERLTLLLGMQNLPLVMRNYVDLMYINKAYLFRPCYNESKLEKCYVDKTSVIEQRNGEFADIMDQYKSGQKKLDYGKKYDVVNSFNNIYFPFTPVVHKKILTIEEYIGLLLGLPYIQNQIKILNNDNYVGGCIKYGGKYVKLKKIQ